MAFRATTAFLVGAALACSSVDGRDAAALREQDLRAARLTEETARRAAAAALAQERQYSARLAQALQETQTRSRSIAAENQGAAGPFDDLLGALRAEIEAGDLKVRRSALQIRITLDERVHFESGSANLSAGGRATLARLAPALAKFSGHQIIVEGHADNNPILGQLRERYATNWELAAARALTVARYLTESGGLSPESVAAVSHGEHQPSASNNTPAGRAENRRIELIIARTVTQAPAPAAQRAQSTQAPRRADRTRPANRPPRAAASRRANPGARASAANPPAPAEGAADTDAAATETPRAPVGASSAAAEAAREDEVDLRR